MPNTLWKPVVNKTPRLAGRKFRSPYSKDKAKLHTVIAQSSVTRTAVAGQRRPLAALRVSLHPSARGWGDGGGHRSRPPGAGVTAVGTGYVDDNADRSPIRPGRSPGDRAASWQPAIAGRRMVIWKPVQDFTRGGFTATLPGHCQERQRNQTVLNINLAGISVRLAEVG